MKYKITRRITEKSLAEPVEPQIITLRGQRVILDADLAEIYGVETRVLNQAVKRNADYFPEDFMFQLTPDEWEDLMSQNVISSMQYIETQDEGWSRSQIVTPSKHGGRRKLPYAFTEHGAIMAATVLNSPKAVAMSVFVVRPFVQMREQLAEIDKTLREHNDALMMIWEQIQPLLAPPPVRPPKKIGCHVKEKRAAYNVRRASKNSQNGQKTIKKA